MRLIMTCQWSFGPGAIIFIQFLLLRLVNTSSLDDFQLADVNVSCPSADTCVGRIPADELEGRSCDCDPSCARHKTCCKDSPYRDVKLPATLEECTWVESINRSVFMVSKCGPNWDGPARTIELCEGGLMIFADPVSIIPVINTVSGLTYANIFCSMCNEDNNIRPWYFQITREEYWGEGTRVCAGVSTRVVEYTNVTGELGWGYWHEYATNRKKFIPLDVTIEIPYDFRSLVAECLEHTISQCPEDWDGQDLVTKCESYMAAIEVPFEDGTDGIRGSRTYRNIPCALCNRVTNLSEASCKLFAKKSRGRAFPKLHHTKLLFPYSLPNKKCLLHIAGVEPREYLENCRTVICDPGYEIKNGRCIPSGIS